ncbi:MAG: hypothetical protein VZQ61_03320 [Christensenellaceae bacterium]
MAKSNIVKQLINNEIDLTVAVRRLYVLTDAIGHEEIKNWADKEINGYTKDDTLPEYRVFKSCELRYSGINGNYQVTSQPLSLTWLKSETVNAISVHRINAPLLEIEENSKADDLLAIDRSYLAGEVEENTSDGFRGVQCFKIEQTVPAAQFGRIINFIYDKTLKALLELDKKYGCLDNLDIESVKISKKDKAELFEELNCILVGKNIKIKNSSIGSGSNTIEKTSHTEIKPEINVSTEKKEKCFLRRLFRRIK